LGAVEERDLAGSIIFKDNLYGMGAGILVAGLWALASERPEKIEKQLATGGLVGTAFGMGLGIWEVSSSEATSRFWSHAQPGLQPLLVYAYPEWLGQGSSVALELRYLFP